MATTDTAVEPETEGTEEDHIDPEASAKPKTLDELLGDTDENVRKAILDTVSKARKEAADYRTKLKAAEPLARQAQGLLDAQKSAEELAAEKANWAELKAATFRDRAVKAEVRALAATQFADPEDASAFLDLASFVDDEGEIDTSSIKSELEGLLKRKPHLARQETTGRPRPDVSQASGGNTRPSTKPEDVFAAFVHENLPH